MSAPGQTGRSGSSWGLTARSPVPPREGVFFCPQRGVNAGASARLRRTTSSLLQTRLQLLAGVLLVAHALALARFAWILPTGVPGTIAGGLVALGVWLALRARDYEYTPLRWVEVLLFGGMLATMSLNQYTILGEALRAGEIEHYREFASRVPGLYVLAMVAHGMFVPNRWSRAALFSSIAAMVAIGTKLLLAWRFRPGGAGLTEYELAESLSFGALMLALGVMLAAYGAHALHGYRRELAEMSDAGMYLLEKKLGSGGMGEVWRAQHRMLRRPVAIKMIRPELEQRDEASLRILHERFRREARATARLESANTVHVFDFGLTRDGTFFYVMEYLEGLDLSQLVGEYGPLPASRTVYLLRQAAVSLREAHERGIVHRDVKPSNIHVGQKAGSWDWVRLVDFGLVKVMEPEEGAVDLTQVDSTTGTPAYFAPELAAGASEATPRSDIYALGAVAYWLVTGQLVFPDRPPLQMMLAHVREEPVPPSKRAEIEVPPRLEALILKSLNKEPDDRPASMDELIATLDSCGIEEPWTPERAAEWWTIHHPDRVARAIPPGPESGSGSR